MSTGSLLKYFVLYLKYADVDILNYFLNIVKY